MALFEERIDYSLGNLNEFEFPNGPLHSREETDARTSGTLPHP
jgi:hypothetical protein